MFQFLHLSQPKTLNFPVLFLLYTQRLKAYALLIELLSALIDCLCFFLVLSLQFHGQGIDSPDVSIVHCRLL